MGSIFDDVDRTKEKNTFLSLSCLLCCVSKNSVELNTLNNQQRMENERTEMLDDGLETDAVPVGSQVDVEEDDETPPTPNISMEMDRMNTQESGIKVMKNHTSSTTSTEVMERRSSSTSQNGLMPQTMSTTNVANTQGAVVMQFSNIQGLHIGAVNNINLQQQQSNRNDEVRKTRRTRTIENMMHSNEDVDEKMLRIVSSNLGEGWQFVIRELGLTDPIIEQANMDFSVYGVKEVIYQLLLDWKNNADDDKCSLGLLTKILWKLNHRECVHQMKETWKNRNVE
ncbi:imd family protein [Megaselia abdita]